MSPIHPNRSFFPGMLLSYRVRAAIIAIDYLSEPENHFHGATLNRLSEICGLRPKDVRDIMVTLRSEGIVDYRSRGRNSGFFLSDVWADTPVGHLISLFDHEPVSSKQFRCESDLLKTPFYKFITEKEELLYKRLNEALMITLCELLERPGRRKLIPRYRPAESNDALFSSRKI